MENDSALFEKYSCNPRENRDSRADVAAAAARAVRGGCARVSNLREALSALTADLQGAPDALTHLLDAAAAAGASTTDVAAFAASSIAWKGVVTTVQGIDPDVFPLEFRKRVMFEAASAASSVLRDIDGLLIGSVDVEEDIRAVAGRYLKILRFHAVNLARCAKRFLEQGTELLPVDACVSAVLRNFASTLNASVLNRRGDCARLCAIELDKHVLVPCAAAVRAVLLMCGTADSISAATRTALAVGRAGLAKEALAGRLLAIAYLIRIANGEGLLGTPLSRGNVLKAQISGPDQGQGGADPGNMQCSDDQSPGCDRPKPAETSSTSDTTKKLTDMLVGAMSTTLLPLLLDVLHHMQACAFSFRSRVGGYSLVAIASSAAADAAMRAVALKTCPSSRHQLTCMLFESVATRSSLVSHVASEAIVALTEECPGTANSVLRSLVVVLRIVMGAGASSADTRWLSLASRICEKICAEDEMNPSVLFAKDVDTSSEARESDASSFEDAVALRVVAGACCVAAERGRRSCDHVFRALRLSREKLATFCKSALMSSASAGRIAEACVTLLPFVCDGRAAAGAALVCMKRPSSATRLVIASVNSLNAATMPEASLKAVASELPRTVQRHGLEICPAVLAFVRRVLACQSCQTKEICQEFVPSVEACLRCVSTSRNPVASSAASYHAREVMRTAEPASLLPATCLELSGPVVSRAKQVARELAEQGPDLPKAREREAHQFELEVSRRLQSSSGAVESGSCIQEVAVTISTLTRAVLNALAKADGQQPGRVPIGVCTEVDALLAVTPALARLSAKPQR